IFNFLADLGLTQAHIKRISEGEDLGTCISTYAAIKIVLTAFMTVIIFAGLFIWKTYFHGGFYDATTESVVIVFIFFYIFSNLQQIAIATFEGTQEIAKRELTRSMGNLVKIPLMLLVILAGVSIAGKTIISSPVNWPPVLQPFQQFISVHAVGSLAMTYVFGTIAICVMGLYLLRGYRWKKPKWVLCKRYFSFASPLLVVSVLGVISANVDKILIGYFWTANEVGQYYSVQQVLQLVSMLPAAVCTVLFPTISEYYSSQFFEKIKTTVRSAERYISMITIPLIVLILIFVNPVVDIMFNSAFLPAASALIVLMMYAFISGLSTPYSSLFSGMNQLKVLVKISVVTCFINIPLNYFFIPQEGVLSSFGINGQTGAALALFLSSFVGFIGLRLEAKKTMNIQLMQSYTVRHILAGFVMGGILYVCNNFIPLVRWYHLITFFFAGLGIYLLVLFVLKEFNKQDLQFFLNLMYPKETFRYIKSELQQKKKTSK
ncbi:MAG: flippase, partial [Euryarchaeota archaeon]|nr:flippase [Euryarchaeota archaeon]